MALLICLVPTAGNPVSQAGRFAKYFGGSTPLTTGNFEAIDYGAESWALVAANVTAAERTAITANADVLAVPANLDATIGGALATVQASLEAANIPAQWVTAGMTWKTLVKGVLYLHLLMQRFRGLGPLLGRLFDGGLTLDSTVGDIPSQTRTRLADAADSYGLDRSGITLNTTIRAALVQLTQQMKFFVRFAKEGL